MVHVKITLEFDYDGRWPVLDPLEIGDGCLIEAETAAHTYDHKVEVEVDGVVRS